MIDVIGMDDIGKKLELFLNVKDDVCSDVAEDGMADLLSFIRKGRLMGWSAAITQPAAGI